MSKVVRINNNGLAYAWAKTQSLINTGATLNGKPFEGFDSSVDINIGLYRALWVDPEIGNNSWESGVIDSEGNAHIVEFNLSHFDITDLSQMVDGDHESAIRKVLTDAVLNLTSIRTSGDISIENKQFATYSMNELLKIIDKNDAPEPEKVTQSKRVTDLDADPRPVVEEAPVP